MATKVCRKCGIEKDVEEFCKCSASLDGRQSHCRRCRIEYNGQHLKTNPNAKAVRDVYQQTKQIRYRLQYAKDHPDKYRRSNAKRRALKAGNGSTLYTQSEIVARDGMVCYLCGEEISSETLELDHVIPLNRGGSDTPDNVRPTHITCNRRKHDRRPDELPWFRDPLGVIKL